MEIESLLLEGLTPALARKLTKLLGKDCKGSLEGGAYAEATEFRACSVKGSGRRAFVIKGWIDPDDGPAVRLRARWGELSDGEAFWQDHPDKAWEDTDNEEVSLKFDPLAPKIELKVVFTAEDGNRYTAKFHSG